MLKELIRGNAITQEFYSRSMNFYESSNENLEKQGRKLDRLGQNMDRVSIILNGLFEGRQTQDEINKLVNAFADRNEAAVSVVKRLGDLIARTPDWFVTSLFSGEDLYKGLQFRGERDFKFAVIVWGMAIEQALREGILFPFADWLDTRKNVERIATDYGNELLLQDSYGRKILSWRHVFNREPATDRLLASAVRNEKHLFHVFFRELANSKGVDTKKWIDQDVFHKKLRELRELRNNAVHEQEKVTADVAERFHNMLMKDGLARDLCKFLAVTSS